MESGCREVSVCACVCPFFLDRARGSVALRHRKQFILSEKSGKRCSLQIYWSQFRTELSPPGSPRTEGQLLFTLPV